MSKSFNSTCLLNYIYYTYTLLYTHIHHCIYIGVRSTCYLCILYVCVNLWEYFVIIYFAKHFGIYARQWLRWGWLGVCVYVTGDLRVDVIEPHFKLSMFKIRCSRVYRYKCYRNHFIFLCVYKLFNSCFYIEYAYVCRIDFWL